MNEHKGELYMETPIIAEYYREHDPKKRKALLEQSIASGEDIKADKIRQELWEARYSKNGSGEMADGYLRFWMAMEFNRKAASRWFGVKSAYKEIKKELDSVKFHEFSAKDELYHHLLYRECCHLVNLYMDLCKTDRSYNSILAGIITIKEEEAKAKLKKDIYETAVCLPRDLGMEEELSVLTKAAREMYELQFPGEGGMPE